MVEYGSYSRTIPTVNFDSKELELFMMDFMMKNINVNKSINEYMGLVMLRLRFKPEDNIRLCNFDNRGNSEQYFHCIVNGRDCYNIKFIDVYNSSNTKILLDIYDREITYECIPLEVSEVGLKIVPVREDIRYYEGWVYTRVLSDKQAKFIMSDGEYNLELSVDKPIDIELPLFINGKYSRYVLDNENLLMDYLYSLTFPIDIISVYRDLCRISLGCDVSRYPGVSLEISNKENKVIDLIKLKNGKLERFGITLPDKNRTLFFNDDGSYSYEMIDRDGLFKLSMNMDGDNTNYNISISGDTDIGMVSKLIRYDVSMVKDNIDSFKKLVRKKIDNSKNGSN